MLLLSRALSINACFLYEQNRREEARSEATCALAVTKKLGAAHLVEQARRLLEIIEKELHDNGKWLKWCSLSHLFIHLIRAQTPNLNDGGEGCLGFLDYGPHSGNLIPVSVSGDLRVLPPAPSRLRLEETLELLSWSGPRRHRPIRMLLRRSLLSHFLPHAAGMSLSTISHPKFVVLPLVVNLCTMLFPCFFYSFR